MDGVTGAATGDTSLNGARILVVGGASGIGRACAELLGRSGARVAVADVAQAAAESVAAGIGDAFGVAVDIADDGAVRDMRATVQARLGGLDGAVNVAGLSSRLAGAAGLRLAEVPEEAFDRLVAVNLAGTWRCMREEISVMLESGGGAIVNIASVSGLGGTPRSAVYSATKHAVVGLTKSAALEYVADGIRINAVCPGPVDTAFLPKTARQAADDLPIGRPARPAEVAEMAIWLLTARASFAVGAAYALDGGFTAA